MLFQVPANKSILENLQRLVSDFNVDSSVSFQLGASVQKQIYFMSRRKIASSQKEKNVYLLYTIFG